MNRRAVWLALGLLIAWTATVAMPVSLAGSQRVGALSSAPTVWESPPGRLTRWQPFSQGLPTHAVVMTVAVQPTDPAVIYAGSYEPPGLWRSDDRGQSWNPDDQGLGGSPIHALLWDTVRRQWWAGTRDGLYTRSVGAASPRPYMPWHATGLRERAVYAIAEDAKGRLYAATEDGLFRSDDADSWEAMPIAGGQTSTATLALAVSLDGKTLLAGMAAQGLWISRDAGAAWSPAADPATEAGKALAQAYVSAVLLDARPGGAAYASTSERAYRSADGGATWQAIPTLEGRVHALAVGADGGVYASLTGQAARSVDSGRTWELYGARLRSDEKVLDLAASPDDPAFLYAAAWDGIYASSDSGASWERRSNGLGHPDVTVLAWDAAGDLLAGTRSGLFGRAPDETSWEAISDIQSRPVLSITGAEDGRSFYAGCSGGLFRSTDGGQTWSEIALELSDAGIAGLIVDPADSDHLHAWVAFGRVHESRDGGGSWVARWDGLGDVRPVTAIHQTYAGRLYVGAEDGLLRWDIARREWQPLSWPLGAPTVFAVRSDPRAEGALYVGTTDGLWRSPDGGKIWRRWGKGLEGRTVTALAISPAGQQIAFAGTRHMGLYATIDGGATWKPVWEDHLATASVRDILFSADGKTVYVASDQGIWQGEGYGVR